MQSSQTTHFFTLFSSSETTKFLFSSTEVLGQFLVEHYGSDLGFDTSETKQKTEQRTSDTQQRTKNERVGMDRFINNEEQDEGRIDWEGYLINK